MMVRKSHIALMITIIKIVFLSMGVDDLDDVDVIVAVAGGTGDDNNEDDCEDDDQKCDDVHDR